MGDDLNPPPPPMSTLRRFTDTFGPLAAPSLKRRTEGGTTREPARQGRGVPARPNGMAGRLFGVGWGRGPTLRKHLDAAPPSPHPAPAPLCAHPTHLCDPPGREERGRGAAGEARAPGNVGGRRPLDRRGRWDSPMGTLHRNFPSEFALETPLRYSFENCPPDVPPWIFLKIVFKFSIEDFRSNSA